MEPALWISDSYDVKDTLIAFLDSSVTEVDEAVRLAWLLTRTRYIFTEGRSDLDVQLLTYITDQIDFDLMSEPALMKLIDAAPYKATATHGRSCSSRSQRAAGRPEDQGEVGKRASDAGWKDLLLAAPQRGIAEWTKAAGQHKDAIARSNAFEAKFFGPSKQAIKGCWPELRKDFVEATKMLKRGSAIEFQQELSEPVSEPAVRPPRRVCVDRCRPQPHRGAPYHRQLVAVPAWAASCRVLCSARCAPEDPRGSQEVSDPAEDLRERTTGCSRPACSMPR